MLIFIPLIAFEYAGELSSAIEKNIEGKLNTDELIKFNSEKRLIEYIRIFETDGLCSLRVLNTIPEILIPFIESCCKEASNSFKL